MSELIKHENQDWMSKIKQSNHINNEDLDFFKKTVGFEDGDKVSTPALKNFLVMAKAYDLNPLSNEIYILYGKPYISYKGLKKILQKSGIDFKIIFKNEQVTNEYAEVTCELFITPKGYRNRMDYFKDAVEIMTIEEAREEATIRGYAKIWVSELNSKMKKHILLMAEKQAFKHALNFANIPDLPDELPVDFDEEYGSESREIKKSSEPPERKKRTEQSPQKTVSETAYKINKSTDNTDNTKIYNKIKECLYAQPETPEGLAKALHDKNFTTFLYEKMKLHKSTQKQAKSVLRKIEEKDETVLNKIYSFFNDYAEQSQETDKEIEEVRKVI